MVQLYYWYVGGGVARHSWAKSPIWLAVFSAGQYFLIAWSVRVSATGLMLQQLVFSATSVLGLKRSGLLEILWQNIKNRWACFLARVKSAKSEG